jgi:hypothetical protein
MKRADWGGTTPPSLPEPLRRPRMLHFGGFVFTDGGIAHDISEAEIEEMQIPPYAPPEMGR